MPNSLLPPTRRLFHNAVPDKTVQRKKGQVRRVYSIESRESEPSITVP